MAEKPPYVPPTIRRYGAFFAGSPTKPVGLMQSLEAPNGERTVASLTVPSWDRDLAEFGNGKGKKPSGE